MWPQDMKEWVEVVAYVAAIAASGAAWWQYRRNSVRERMRWLFEMYDRFYGSEKFQDMFVRIDRGETRFVEQDDRDLMQKLDEYLNFFEFVGILCKRQELGQQEIQEMFDYPLRKVAQEPAILRYLRGNGYEQLDALLKDLGYAS